MLVYIIQNDFGFYCEKVKETQIEHPVHTKLNFCKIVFTFSSNMLTCITNIKIKILPAISYENSLLLLFH